MHRQRQRIQGLLLGLGLLFSAASQALSLGDLVVYSRPGEPLRAIIPLRLDGGERLAQVSVSLADEDGYAAEQLERPLFLEGMHLVLLDKGEGRGRIQLRGVRPWQGQGADLLLQIVWPEGELTERFRLAEVATDDGQSGAAPRYVEVGDNDTLDAIAIRLSRKSNRSYLHMMYALYKANPEAFYGGNMNNLKGNVKLRVPTEAELYALSDGEVFRGIREQYSQWREKTEDEGKASAAGAALAGISDEEATTLARAESPEELQAQLKRLAVERKEMAERNKALRERLAKLEEKVQQVSEKVLEYPSTPVEKAGTGPVKQPQDKLPHEKQTTAIDNVSEEIQPATEKKAIDELPASVMLLLILLSLGTAVMVWRYASHPPRGGN